MIIIIIKINIKVYMISYFIVDEYKII